LTNHGGPVTGTTTPGELTVTPVYWVPSGGSYSFPAGYETLINQFISDAAHDSGKTTNVFASLTQYTNASSAHLSYLLHSGTPITDTDPFPSSGCTPDSGTIWGNGGTFSQCITDAQLASEASAFTTANSLPNTDLAHLYFFFLPEGVETCFTSTNGAGGGACNDPYGAAGFCGYHSSAAGPLLYSDVNFPFDPAPDGVTCSSDGGSNTSGNQSPNSNIAADTAISITSHETSETITDPEGSAWYDASGYEIGDECAYIYGDSASFVGLAGHKYNQTINGHHYFIQTEFSNQDFAAKPTYSCIQREDLLTVSPASGAAGATVHASGSGFASTETVTVTFYKTALSTVKLCSAVTTDTGTFSCSGKIPTSPGALGGHKIVAKGATSLRAPKVTFTVT